jgi:hypothetical protein
MNGEAPEAPEAPDAPVFDADMQHWQLMPGTNMVEALMVESTRKFGLDSVMFSKASCARLYCSCVDAICKIALFHYGLEYQD